MELVEKYKGFGIYRDEYALVVVNISNPHFVVGERVATYFGIIKMKERDSCKKADDVGGGKVG